MGLVVGLMACGSSSARDADGAPVEAGDRAPGGEWERLPEPPLAPRSGVAAVWTGREVIFVGGDTFLCPPGADCVAPDEPPLADGAAFDPGAGSWRPIAPSPVAFSDASTAVVGDDVYFLVTGTPGRPGADRAFLRYSVPEDAWHELTLPDGELGWYRLVGAGDVVVAVSGSHESGDRPDLVFDPRGDGAWEELPADPLTPGFDRTMVWSGRQLYLFDHELVPNPGSERPSLTRAARLDLGTRQWERLPDSEILSTGPWFVDEATMVNPDLGGADGGEVNGWGRRYPNGGILDTNTSEWSLLPPAPGDAQAAGVLGSDGALVHAATGWLLDLDTDSWIELPDPPESPEYTRRNVVAAGTDIVVFGGERWADGAEGELLGDAWIWRSGRTP